MVNGAQIRMARAALNLKVRELAELAQVSPNTVTRVEADMQANATTLGALQRVLEAAGAEFIDAGAPSNNGGPGVRLRKAE